MHAEPRNPDVWDVLAEVGGRARGALASWVPVVALLAAMALSSLF